MSDAQHLLRQLLISLNSNYKRRELKTFSGFTQDSPQKHFSQKYKIKSLFELQCQPIQAFAKLLKGTNVQRNIFPKTNFTVIIKHRKQRIRLSKRNYCNQNIILLDMSKECEITSFHTTNQSLVSKNRTMFNVFSAAFTFRI